jgi:predicted Zn-dependent protease
MTHSVTQLVCRAAEYEADAIGIHLLAKACYDPDANITMLQKLEKAVEKQGGAQQPELLSTHPLTQVCLNMLCIFLHLH